jgi:hypothetical protein
MLGYAARCDSGSYVFQISFQYGRASQFARPIGTCFTRACATQLLVENTPSTCHQRALVVHGCRGVSQSAVLCCNTSQHVDSLQLSAGSERAQTHKRTSGAQCTSNRRR